MRRHIVAVFRAQVQGGAARAAAPDRGAGPIAEVAARFRLTRDQGDKQTGITGDTDEGIAFERFG